MSLRLAAASLRARWRLSVLLALGLAVSTLAFVSIRAGLEYESDRMLDAIRSVSAADLVVRYTDIPPAVLAEIRAFPGVAHVEPGLHLSVAYSGESGYLAGTEIPTRFFRLKENLVRGTLPTSPGQFATTESSAARLGLTVGDRVSFGVRLPRASGQSAGGEAASGETASVSVSLTLSGVVKDGTRTPQQPFTDLRQLQKLSGLNATAALILLEDDVDTTQFLQSFTEAVKKLLPGAKIESELNIYHEATAQRTQASVTLGSYSLLLVGAVGLSVWTLAGIHVAGRYREIGGLLAAGLPPANLFLAGVLEILVIGALGFAFAFAALPAITPMLVKQKVFLTVSASARLTSGAVVLAATMGGWLLPLVAALTRPVSWMLRGRM
jgi:ABC-type lipoprotein release transport system permease subunit